MPIVQQGSINTTALVVPDLYVQIVPPQNLVLNGVPTNVVGVVGTASWGPVGQPVIVATMADYAQSFGPHHRAQIRHGHPGCDRGPAGCAELPLRAGDRRHRRRRAGRWCPAPRSPSRRSIPVRSATRWCLPLAPVRKANTWRLTVTLPGLQPEVYDNIAGTGAAFWQRWLRR